MGFQWDEGKNESNHRKHNVSFRQAADVFGSPFLVWRDLRRDYGEVRFCAVGESGGHLLRVAFTHRDDDIRIISAWKAGRNDRARYEEFKAREKESPG